MSQKRLLDKAAEYAERIFDGKVKKVKSVSKKADGAVVAEDVETETIIMTPLETLKYIELLNKQNEIEQAMSCFSDMERIIAESEPVEPIKTKVGTNVKRKSKK